MINSNQKFNTVKKDRLFYGQFEYCISFVIPEASCLRAPLTHESIDDTIERRRIWREITQQRWRNNKHKAGIILRHQQKREITDETANNLHDLADMFLNCESEYKLVFSIDTAWCYTNDLNLIERLDRLGILHQKSYSQAVIVREKDTIVLKNPRHLYRSYFKFKGITQQQKENLQTFLNNYDDIRIGPALKNWLEHPFLRTQDYFFVDYNSQQWLTMLSLVVPGVIRKTVQIIADK